MMRLFASAGAMLVLGAAPFDAAQGGQIPVHQEPNHRTLLYTAQLRLLDVALPAGASHVDHRHDYDVATVNIESALTRTRRPGEAWSDPRPRAVGSVNITEYTGTPGVHRTENVDTRPYRVMAVENVREGNWTTPALLSAAGTTLLQQSRAFAVYEVRLDAATPRTTHMHEVPAVAVLVSGAFQNQGGGGETPFRLPQPGRWLLTPMGQAHTMSVGAAGTAHIVEFEAR